MNVISEILTCRFLVPGWRMGWITIHDRNHAFEREVGLCGLHPMKEGLTLNSPSKKIISAFMCTC